MRECGRRAARYIGQVVWLAFIIADENFMLDMASTVDELAVYFPFPLK